MSANQLVTLAQASRHLGKRDDYFTVRRYRGSTRAPFPEPVANTPAQAAHVKLYRLDELLAWDRARLNR